MLTFFFFESGIWRQQKWGVKKKRQGKWVGRSKVVHYGVGHTLTRRYTVSHLGTWEIFGKKCKGWSWNILEQSFGEWRESKNLLAGSFASLASHYSEFTSLGSCWEGQNLHEYSWVWSGHWSCWGCKTTTTSMLEAMQKLSVVSHPSTQLLPGGRPRRLAVLEDEVL